MTIADNQELSLLLAVIERALRDANGAHEPTAKEARAFLDHIGVDWRRAPPRGKLSQASMWPSFHTQKTPVTAGKLSVLQR